MRGEMVWVLGGTFRMGSDKHYPEEAPVHRVTVDGFWIDSTPVTNQEFRKFVQATGYIIVAQIPPDPKDYPGALPTCFMPARSYSRRPRTWWICVTGADGGLFFRVPIGTPPLWPEKQHWWA
jgi:formylglycine-generating enzyme